MCLSQTSLYENLNKNCNLLYPGKNIQLITLNILGGDNYNKENAYNPNSEESIFSPNHTNEESGDNLAYIASLDEDNEEKDHSLISKDSNFYINKANDKPSENFINFPSSDNYIEEYDDSLNSKFSFFSINQANDKSRENFINFPSSDNYIIKDDDSYFFINQTNNKSRENLLNFPSLDNYIIKNVDSQISNDNILSLNLIKEKSRKNQSNSHSLDNNIKKNDDILNSKDNVLPPSPKNEESKNNLNNLFKNNTDISSHNELLIEIASNNSQINESKIFNITSPQKRGRKSKKSNQKSHDSSSDDNCLLKIQNHFFNFIINLANEALQKENIKVRFILIDYKLKRQVNHDFFCKLKTYSIKKILEMDTSSKYRSKSKDFNRETINKIDYTNWLNDFFSINYLDLFFVYHNKEKPLLNFEFNGKKIELSKAKSFYYLLNNRNNKGKKTEKDLSNIAKRFFIDDNSTLNRILFQTKETIDLME